MITITTTFKMARGLAQSQRHFNRWVRAALIAAAQWWIQRSLPRHFETGAVQAFQFDARSTRYAKRKRDWAKATGQVPRPLVYSGDLERAVKARSLDQYRYRVAATSTKQRIRVGIKAPHKISRRTAFELAAYNRSDFENMRKVAAARMRFEMKQAGRASGFSGGLS